MFTFDESGALGFSMGMISIVFLPVIIFFQLLWFLILPFVYKKNWVWCDGFWHGIFMIVFIEIDLWKDYIQCLKTETKY